MRKIPAILGEGRKREKYEHIKKKIQEVMNVKEKMKHSKRGWRTMWWENFYFSFTDETAFE